MNQLGDGNEASLRILLTLHHSLDLNAGAPGATVRLAEALRRRGQAVSLFAFDDMPIQLESHLANLVFPFFVTAQVWRRLIQGQVDVVESSTGDTWPLSRSAIADAKAIVVTRSHGLEHVRHLRTIEAEKAGELRLRKRYFLYHGGVRLRQVARTLETSDGSIFTNFHERLWAVTNLNISPRRTMVASNGLPGELEGRKLEGSGMERHPRIAIVGRFAWVKGAATAAKVVSEILKQWPEVEASWIGAEPTAVRNAIDTGIQRRVTVVSHYEVPELPSLLRQHEILLFLSEVEGFSITLIESMACGLIPVASDIPALREVLEGTGAGILVPRGDVNAAVEAIDRLLENPGVRSVMRQRAHERAQTYSWDAIADRRIDFYLGLLRSKQRRVS